MDWKIGTRNGHGPQQFRTARAETDRRRGAEWFDLV